MNNNISNINNNINKKNELENKKEISNNFNSDNSNMNKIINNQNQIQENNKIKDGLNPIFGEISNKEKNLNEKDEIIKEAHIDGHLYSMSLKTMKFFCNQMETSICKIQKPNNIFGTGFICKIKSKNNLYKAPVLITCNHVLNENDLKIGNEIDIVFNNTYYIKLKINKLRKIYTNKDYDITIIELKKNDNFKEEDMLEIDENIFKEDYQNYKKKQIYILHIPNGTEIRYSSEVIRNIDILGKIEHFCSTESGSSGAPIINFETRKVLGIHIGYNLNKKINLGTLLNNPIAEVFKIYNIEK
jgi:ribosomal protein L7Ae-like RNA K-turn-binding protein